ncbi:tRNA (adenosine(37)-N6)-threonylcarbamoyltransferase complex dimerization subunit type 1 TsaB [Microbacterium sp. NPDC056234]|uniref:tRNA (adenosine(37)-N6)-threonylcarbamoyltransferase complex dimerization subunit type 1 TsaB n=1 Tax=Microbacterium sp. NPDC056234 TaxID=3345757 RepID=UPI0035E1043A
MILAVDTSLGSAVAIVDGDGARLSDASSPDPLGHAEVIGDLLVRAVHDAGPGRIDHVVAGMGPGPFTGLRIGIATARTFALGRGVDVIPVPSHFAPALTELERDAVAGRFAIVTDARRREVAITVFEGLDADGIPTVVADTVLVPRVDAETHLDGIRSIETTVLDAAALAGVGLRAARAGRTLAGQEPLYLRQPDVTLPGAPKKVGS